MKNWFILLLLLALSSCSSFERMKYGHVNKVPATPQQLSPVQKREKISQVTSAAPQSVSVQPANDSLFGLDSAIAADSENLKFGSHQIEVITPSQVSSNVIFKKLKNRAPIKRDWTLVIGLLFMIGGLLALSLCIFYYPFAGLNFLWVIAFEILTLFAAWKLLGTGITYFITRFRGDKAYKEN
jgi:hypothetical protein